MQWRNSRRAWGIVSVLLHWVTAVLFLGQFWLGLTMVVEPSLLEKFRLYQLHKSIGMLILSIVILRALWTLSGTRPALPATMSDSEHKIAWLSHFALYLFLFSIPMTGWALVSASPLMIPTVFFGQFVIPHLPVGVSLTLEQTFSTIHAILAYTAIFLVGVHSLAALRHHFHYRDATLVRMLKPGHDGETSGDQ